MGKTKLSDLRKMWFVFATLLLITSLEIWVTIYQPLSQDIMKWGLALLITAKVLYTLSYFIYLKQKKKKFIRVMLFPSVLLLPFIMFVFLLEKGLLNM